MDDAELVAIGIAHLRGPVSAVIVVLGSYDGADTGLGVPRRVVGSWPGRRTAGAGRPRIDPLSVAEVYGDFLIVEDSGEAEFSAEDFEVVAQRGDECVVAILKS